MATKLLGMTCPKCGDGLVLDGEFRYCEGCGFENPRPAPASPQVEEMWPEKLPERIGRPVVPLAPRVHSAEPFSVTVTGRRGDIVQVGVVACRLCPAEFVLKATGLEALKTTAKRKGWVFPKDGSGALCPGCREGVLS